MGRLVTAAVLWKIQLHRQTVRHRYNQFRFMQNSVCAGNSGPYLLHKSGSVFSGMPYDEWMTTCSTILNYILLIYDVFNDTVRSSSTKDKI
jgi:hypothetical protein